MFEITPQLNDLLTDVQIWMGGTIGGVASCMAMVAGFMRTIGLREEGKRRYKDAIMGLCMVMTAPTLILLIATVLKAILPKAATTAVIIMVGNTIKVV
jgi:ABC-type spermidine/putrescine transport system permease subunit II